MHGYRNRGGNNIMQIEVSAFSKKFRMRLTIVIIMRGSKTFSSSAQPVDNYALFNIARYRKWDKFVIIRAIRVNLNFEKISLQLI